MPTYDYRCKACGHEFEEFQSIMAAPLKKCPQCQKNKLARLIGIGAGIIFKGSGFYETDYRSDSYKKAAKAEKDLSSSAPAAGESTKSEPNKSEPAKSESSAKSDPVKSNGSGPNGHAKAATPPKSESADKASK